MTATKETAVEAGKALGRLNAWATHCGLTIPGYVDCDFFFLTDFLAAVERQLPTQASVTRSNQRKRRKHREAQP